MKVENCISSSDKASEMAEWKQSSYLKAPEMKEGEQIALAVIHLGAFDFFRSEIWKRKIIRFKIHFLIRAIHPQLSRKREKMSAENCISNFDKASKMPERKQSSYLKEPEMKEGEPITLAVIHVGALISFAQKFGNSLV
ncbi:hypothetical protein CDAR_312481 [Caerostris darwini]|uniref:Uncharacterized protein n=1 Tax=Caerostris darwini TaxID=1538125 RepID=A0AAV4N3E9_9ARAC|nr:hypothetical protein CDAR_312481 [Caerostris darwini]